MINDQLRNCLSVAVHLTKTVTQTKLHNAPLSTKRVKYYVSYLSCVTIYLHKYDFWGGAFGGTKLSRTNVHCFLTFHEPDDQRIIPGLKINTPTHQVDHVYMCKLFAFN